MNAFKQWVKRILRDDSHKYVEYEGRQMWHHDVVHIEVSKLVPIDIDGHQVDGISGINIPEFHGEDHFVPMYDGMLDEARVGFHQWMSYPHKPYSWVILVNYVVYLASKGINPIVVILRHAQTLK